jgi:hypothetical protein
MNSAYVNAMIAVVVLATGEIMGTHLGHGSFILQITAGTGTETNVDTGICLPANRSATNGQTATLTANNGDVISFNTVGKLCEELGHPSSLQYIADYRITGGDWPVRQRHRWRKPGPDGQPQQQGRVPPHDRPHPVLGESAIQERREHMHRHETLAA